MLLTSHLLASQKRVHITWCLRMFASRDRSGGPRWTGLGEEHKLFFMGLVSIFRDLTENTTNLNCSGCQDRKTAYREGSGYTRGRSALGYKATPRQSQDWPNVWAQKGFSSVLHSMTKGPDDTEDWHIQTSWGKGWKIPDINNLISTTPEKLESSLCPPSKQCTEVIKSASPKRKHHHINESSFNPKTTPQLVSAFVFSITANLMATLGI